MKLKNDFEPAASRAYLGELSEHERASLYPYMAPEGGYLLAKGRLFQLNQRDLEEGNLVQAAPLLFGRTPVLAVGSNRAPYQLLRKFGSEAIVPVTPARLHDCDVVHTALVSYYGAIPCTAFPSSGTITELKVVWLNEEQLLHMHNTEGIGIAYDYVEMQGVEHQLKVPAGPVFGYAACLGVLAWEDTQPAGLAAIAAQARQFKTVSQGEVVQRVCKLTNLTEACPVEQFITTMQADKTLREEVIGQLQTHAIQLDQPPWRVIPVSIDGIDDYL
ncbi:MAG: hypothetical protein HN867_00770 [Deltaproteobacteria bacterium]|nr:hypothetical protein [Deltaproteobacteria bacterium]